MHRGITAALCVITITLINFYLIPFQKTSGQEDLAQGIGGLFEKLSNSLTEATLTRNITYSDPKQIVNSSYFIDNLVATSHGNNVYVVWTIHSNDKKSSIFFKASHDNGSSFNNIKKISDKIGLQSKPSIAAYGDNVYICWAYHTLHDDSIFFRASNDGGQTFLAPVKLGTVSKFQSPSIISSGNNVYVTWLEESSGSSKIHLALSTNSGGKFNDTIINSSKSVLSSPILAYSNGTLYVAWSEITPAESKIQLYQSVNSTSPNQSKHIEIANKSRYLDPLSLASTANHVYLGWLDGIYENSSIKLADYDNLHGAKVNTLATNQVGFIQPLFSATNKEFYVAELRTGEGYVPQLVVSTIEKNGTISNFSNAIVEDKFVPNIANVELGSSDKLVYLAWFNTSGVLIRGSTNEGMNWDKAFKLHDVRDLAGEDAIPVSLATTSFGNKLYIFWKGISIEPTGLNNEILFRGGSASIQ